MDGELPRDPDEELIPEPIARAIAEGRALSITYTDPETGEEITEPFHGDQPGAWGDIARAGDGGN